MLFQLVRHNYLCTNSFFRDDIKHLVHTSNKCCLSRMSHWSCRGFGKLIYQKIWKAWEGAAKLLSNSHDRSSYCWYWATKWFYPPQKYYLYNYNIDILIRRKKLVINFILALGHCYETAYIIIYSKTCSSDDLWGERPLLMTGHFSIAFLYPEERPLPTKGYFPWAVSPDMF